MRSSIKVGQEGLIIFSLDAKGLCGHSDSFTPNSRIHVFNIALYTGGQSYWFKKGPFLRRITISQMP